MCCHFNQDILNVLIEEHIDRILNIKSCLLEPFVLGPLCVQRNDEGQSLT